ncbi:bZIP transcription factor 11-like [Momordica charantia]|uniref:BZIP transcription factor 11-like n=1 Tax=Momordica charantia TaxID=3673 RepID=A0A6J1CWC2_MOMCH|nr:bZIP transcription factor 11-like [Momordica charantia]
MGSSSGTCSNSSVVQSCGSEEEMQAAALMEQRKRKRMVSNRESARRSRLRKQKHLDDLMAQVAHLTKDNHQILATLGATAQQFAAVEAENSILRAQAAELDHRLQSLAEIIHFLNPTNGILESGCGGPDSTAAAAAAGYFSPDPFDICGGGGGSGGGGGGSFNPLQMAFYMNHPLMASADIFEDY